MVTSAYFTDSQVRPEGRGGDVVSFHELNALQTATHVRSIYQRVGELLVQKTYPQNPYMYDYYMASIIDKPEEIELAQFYGSSWTVTMKVLHKAVKIATCPAHNLDISLEEWRNNADVWGQPFTHLSDPFLFELGAHGLRSCNAVVCPSKASIAFLQNRLGLTNTVLIPHGTDLPEKWSSHRDEFVVFHLGQLGPDKGQKYLKQAWDMLQPLPNASLVVAGANNPRSSITKEAKEEYYGKAAVYVQPSVTEGWGLPVGEAMAHGTPVIVTEGVGAADMVTDGHDGFIVPIRNPQVIADKIRYFYEHPAEIERMGSNARAKAEQYSWKNIEQHYVELVSGLM